MNTLRQVCHCGHDIDTHHERKHDCLGMGCNDCHSYRDASKPKPKDRKPKPYHAPSWNRRTGRYDECGCYECNEWRRANT